MPLPLSIWYKFCCSKVFQIHSVVHCLVHTKTWRSRSHFIPNDSVSFLAKDVNKKITTIGMRNLISTKPQQKSLEGFSVVKVRETLHHWSTHYQKFSLLLTTSLRRMTPLSFQYLNSNIGNSLEGSRNGLNFPITVGTFWQSARVWVRIWDGFRWHQVLRDLKSNP